MDAGVIIQFVAALGLGGIITKLIESATSWAKDRRGAEKDAWEQRDDEARARRQLEETLHMTRRIAMDAGVPLAEIDQRAPWPEY